MKPRILTVILLFISSYSPLFIIFAAKDFDFYGENCFKHPMAIYILISITILSVIILFATVLTIKRGNMCIEVVSVKNRSVDLINYSIPYMIAFFGADLSKPADLISVSIFLLIMLLLTITTKSVFINPILSLVGYGLYDLEYRFDSKIFTTIVISKYDMKPGEFYYIKNLTRFIYFITGSERVQDGN